jgi:hypothetical protein
MLVMSGEEAILSIRDLVALPLQAQPHIIT